MRREQASEASAPRGAESSLGRDPSGDTLDPRESEKFLALAERWWDPEGPLKPLHDISPQRLAYLRDRLAAHFGLETEGTRPIAGLRLLDVGCGGGLVCEPLARLGAEMTGLDPVGESLAAARAQAAAPPAPDWLTRRPSAPPRAPARHAASALGDAHERRAGGDLPPDLARLKGEAIHAALEEGSTDPAAIRGAVARFPLSDALVEEAAAEAARACALPEAAPFFAPEALAEVGVAVEIAGARLVGRIDRLVASPGRVDFVDFKSDAAPPPEGEPPAAYLAQLAAYRAALRRLHPEAEVEAHILWTAVPRLERIAPETLDEATVAAALAAP
ncbi:MAG: PD-(D/E)XK nuclease family protein [Pseudomonadota bacterium]